MLGVVRRPKMVRTEAGERALEEYRRHEAALSALPASKDEASAVIASAAGLALLSPRTLGGDAFGGGGFGDVFDGGFDYAFDSSFDSAFDSGFSDGGGDGGGNGGGGGD